MTVVVVTPPDPQGGLVSLEIAKKHLRVEHGDDDTLIAAQILAIEGEWGGPTGSLGVALRPQELRLSAAGFGGRDGLELTSGPVTEVQSVKWLDTADDEHELDASGWVFSELTNRVRLTGSRPASAIEVRVQYAAGFAEVPKQVQAATLLYLNILYDQPEEKAQAALERSRDALLSPMRKRRV